MRRKIIPTFPDYEITKTGKIWSNLTNRYLRPGVRRGYLGVVVWKNKKKYNRYVHRLVLETYIGPCPEGMESRHLNGNRLNNKIKNLVWGTRKQNGKDRAKHGTSKGENNGRSKLTNKVVRLIIRMYQTGMYSQKQIGKRFNVDQTTIHYIVTQKTWKNIWSKQYAY